MSNGHAILFNGYRLRDGDVAMDLFDGRIVVANLDDEGPGKVIDRDGNETLITPGPNFPRMN